MATDDNLKSLSVDKRGLLTNENLGIRTATWACWASKLEDTHDIKLSFAAVQKFYIEMSKNIQKNFLFGDLLRKDLVTLQPNKTLVSTTIPLVKRLRQVGIDTPEMLEKLRKELWTLTVS